MLLHFSNTKIPKSTFLFVLCFCTKASKNTFIMITSIFDTPDFSCNPVYVYVEKMLKIIQENKNSQATQEGTLQEHFGNPVIIALKKLLKIQ